ncbi:MAG: Lrp/AsnC family transcriptional regulator [Acidimicrobiales bacterium]
MLKDQIDRQIIALLGRNSRTAYPAIGAEVGLSASAVKRRIDRLVDDGTITGFTVTVDPAALGVATEAFVELHCRGRTSPDQLRQLALSQPIVAAAYTVSGSADALFHLRCADNRELEAALEQIRADPAVERTSSVIVLSRLVAPG